MSRIVVGMLILSFSLAGCSLKEQAMRELSREQGEFLAAAAEVASLYAAEPEFQNFEVKQEAQQEAVVPQDAPVLSPLREYILVALSENPAVKAAFASARARLAQIGQVTGLPDPMLNTKSLPEPNRTAEGDSYFSLSFSQKIPLPARLRQRGRVALEETRMALEELERTRLEVIADVKRAYFRLFVIDRSLTVTSENQELLKGLIEVVRAQVSAGARGQDDLLRAQVELSNLEAKLVRLRQQRKTAQAMLNKLLDRASETPVPIVAAFEIRAADLSVQKLLAIAAKESPLLRERRHELVRSEEALDLAKLAYWPDFSLGAEWMQMESRDAGTSPMRLSEDGSDNFAVMVGLTIPIWFDRIESEIEQAKRNLEASKKRYEDTENQVYFQVEEAVAAVRANEELARLFQTTILPQSEEAYRVSQAAYIGGSSDFLNVIDNWRKWLVYTVQYYRTLGQLEASVADLEQVVGTSAASLGSLLPSSKASSKEVGVIGQRKVSESDEKGRLSGAGKDFARVTD